MIKILRWILLPISFIYQIITWLRNFLFDKKILKTKSYDIPTIVIGNLAVGGTGKSPMTEYLIRLLENQYKIATLSRGYGRKTKGFRFVELSSQSIEVGDEPLQFKKKFSDITVAVSEDRCHGIENLKDNHDLIILDDAYQHRKLNPGFSILLFDFNSLLKPILPLPTGDFRDNISASKRADIIIITKSPKLITAKVRQHINTLLRTYNTQAEILYTCINYSLPINSYKESLKENLTGYEILLFTGIANPKPLEIYLQNLGNKVYMAQYPDHHNYSDTDFEKVTNTFHKLNSSKKIIITTEKDMQRIDLKYFQSLPLYYIPIQLEFMDNKKETFDTLIQSYIQSNI